MLKKMQPHKIVRHEQEVGAFMVDALKDILGSSPLEIWSRHTRSFYTLEGLYDNHWKYDKVPIYKAPELPRLKEAVAITRKAFALRKPVLAYGWDQLADVPFIETSGAGYGYVGKKSATGNQRTRSKKSCLQPKTLAPG